MNTKLLDSLVQIIHSLPEDEQQVLQEKLLNTSPKTGQKTHSLIEVLSTLEPLDEDLPDVDQDCLIDLSIQELQALSETKLNNQEQEKLDNLLLKNQENQLSNQEGEELEHFLAKIDALNLLKTRARYTLSKLKTEKFSNRLKPVAT